MNTKIVFIRIHKDVYGYGKDRGWDRSSIPNYFSGRKLANPDISEDRLKLPTCILNCGKRKY